MDILVWLLVVYLVEVESEKSECGTERGTPGYKGENGGTQV